MHHAANLGHDKVVKMFISYSRFSEVVNMKTKEGKTALHYSAWRGHTEATSLLLQNGGSVSIIEDVRNHSELFSDYFLFLSHELNDTF